MILKMLHRRPHLLCVWFWGGNTIAERPAGGHVWQGLDALVTYFHKVCRCWLWRGVCSIILQAPCQSLHESKDGAEFILVYRRRRPETVNGHTMWFCALVFWSMQRDAIISDPEKELQIMNKIEWFHSRVIDFPGADPHGRHALRVISRGS